MFYSPSKMSILQDLLDVKYLLSLDVPYKDIVRMIKLHAVWTVIVASAVAYLQNIKYQFSPHFSHPYPAKRPISHKNDDYFVVLPFAMRHASHPLFTGLRKIRVSMWHIAHYICTTILITWLAYIIHGLHLVNPIFL